MGGEGGFLDKLMMLLSGGQAPPSTPPMPEGKPWEQPLSGRPVGVSPMMPSPSPSPMPPASVAEDPMAQAVELARQRELVKRMIPDFVNR